MRLVLKVLLPLVLAESAACGNIPSAMPFAGPTYLYASQSGQPTLDSDDTGGNPFATALVEMLSHQSLTFAELRGGLIDITLDKSYGLQHPDVAGHVVPEMWAFLPSSSSKRRVALVIVYSEYRAAGPLVSLPGARYDAARITSALENVGFATTMIVDPNRNALTAILSTFKEASSKADVSVIYTTGHGAEVKGNVYLLPGTFSLSTNGTGSLDEDAVPISRLGAAMRSSQANLLFYGGCRNNPMEVP